jgi:hypothetical protein
MSGGSAPESFCKISVYLKHHAPAFYEILDNLCLLGSLNPRGNQGMTLLLPDKKTQDKIGKALSSDAKVAVNMIDACILKVFMGSIADFGGKTDIPKKDGCKLAVKQVTSAAVELNNGSTITADNAFKRLYPESQIAVFQLKGDPVLAGEKSTIATGRGVRGGNDVFANPRFTSDGSEGAARGASFAIVVKLARANVTIVGMNSGIDHLTHLGISLLNYLDNKSGHLHALGDVFKKVYILSPLYVFFMLAIMTNEERLEWSNTNLQYCKCDKLKEQARCSNIPSSIIRKLKSREVIDAMTVTSISSTIHDKFLEFTKLAMAGTDFTPFGGELKFSQWLLLANEFCFIYTKHYMEAVASGNNATINKIMDAFERWSMPACISKNWTVGLILVRKENDNSPLYAIELLCTITQAYLSRTFLSTGADIDEELKISEGDSSGGYLHSTKLPPNNAREHSSYFDIVKKYSTQPFMTDKSI